MIQKSAAVDLLCHVLDAAQLRHKAIADNIANVNTPGYRRQEVSFEVELDHILAGSGKPTGATRTSRPTGELMGTDTSVVDLDAEMGLLNQNSLLMTAAAQVLAMKLAQLRSAITGR